MSTKYHVVGQGWQSHEPLLSMDEHELRFGERPECIWCDDEQYQDSDAICLFDNIADAQAFRDDYRPGCHILAVRTDGLTLTTVSEGYQAVLREIPSDCVEVIA
jgi:hypothetical protein